MDLPTALSKFIIQEYDNLYYFYCEESKPKEVLKKNLITKNNQSYTYQEIHNEIILNQLAYNFLINKTK